MNQYLIEYMGSLVIAYTIIFSNDNPILIGLVHTSVLFIAKTFSLEGQFTPLTTICHFLLNRINLIESLTVIGIHTLAALSILLIYEKKTLM
jgi:hypothetical protein